MKKLFLLVVLLLIGGLVAIEAVAPSLVAARIEAQVDQETDGSAAVTAQIDSFPFVTRLLTSGTARRVTVRLDRFARQDLDFANVTIQLDGVRIDRGALLAQKVVVRDIDRGVITALVDVGVLAPILGGVIDQVDGPVVDTLASALPNDVLPCRPEVEVVGEQFRLTCTVDEIPPVLLAALNGA